MCLLTGLETTFSVLLMPKETVLFEATCERSHCLMNLTTGLSQNYYQWPHCLERIYPFTSFTEHIQDQESHSGPVISSLPKRVHVKRCNLMLNFWSAMKAPIGYSGQAAK